MALARYLSQEIQDFKLNNHYQNVQKDLRTSLAASQGLRLVWTVEIHWGQWQCEGVKEDDTAHFIIGVKRCEGEI